MKSIINPTKSTNNAAAAIPSAPANQTPDIFQFGAPGALGGKREAFGLIFRLFEVFEDLQL